MKGLAMVILDALGVNLLRAHDMDYAYDLYKKNGNTLTCSTYTHTQTSNIMIWSGQHRNWFWVRNKTNQWIDPAQNMDRDNEFRGAFRDDDKIEVITYNDLIESDVRPIWHTLERKGYRARALQLPIVLPPYSYRAPEETSHWFPYKKKDMKQNRQDKHRLTMKALEEIADDELDFYCTSFPQPDKLLHGIAEGHCTEEWAGKEIHRLDYTIKKIDQFCNENDIGYCIFGDHGPGGDGGPQFGRHFDQKINVVRHGKHSCILSNMDDVPTYTHKLYDFMLEKMDEVERTK